MPERTQLLQRFDAFERRRRQLRVGAQEARAVGIKSHMTIRRHCRRQGGFFADPRKMIARIGNWRPRKIHSIAISLADDLDDIGIEEIGRLGDRVRDGGDIRAADGELLRRLGN